MQVIKGLKTENCAGLVFSVAPARSIVEDLVEEKDLDPPESLGMAGDFSRLSPRYRVLVERTKVYTLSCAEVSLGRMGVSPFMAKLNRTNLFQGYLPLVNLSRCLSMS